MLEGMANHQRRAIFEVSRNLLLYAPACQRSDFLNAIGYLIRRLDENTGEENFLRYAFRLCPDSPEWARLSSDFLEAMREIESVPARPRRNQDQRQSPKQPPAAMTWRAYENEPDTDWALPHHSLWADEILSKWKQRSGNAATFVPLTVAGKPVDGSREIIESTDPSRPGTVVCRYALAQPEDLDRAVRCAADDPSGWRSLEPNARYEILRRVAQQIREQRGDLLGAAAADGGKTLLEGDPEVSEAVDFVEFYALAARELFERPGLRAEGRGVVVVVSPWNFPLAIPCGGVAAALAAGNTVILKPASDTVLPAALICECFWAGGVPREALQLLPCRGRDAGPALVNHALVDVVILTGGTETAESMLRQKPDLDLMAETGGKNATIVTALSDRDLAIKHVLHAAFSHSGQKCSATSLLLLEDEVYQDPIFRRALIDAARSLKVGSVWDKASKMGPLIRPPSDVLERGLKELEPGESWALMPEDAADNPGLWTPGVKWDVQPGSFTHMTELFGPVLAVMRFRRLDDAIGLVNATGFGLTSGLQSLDDREQAVWRQSIKAGNLYINRATTGAIVLRQPFGGMGKSAFGPGLKAGGPNYVVPLMRFEEKDDPTAIDRWLSVERAAAAQAEPELVDTLHRLSQGPDAEKLAAIVGSESMEAVRSRLERGLASYCYWARTEFTVEHDEQRLVGQDNFRRYLPIRQLHLRLMPGDRADDVILALFAARCVNCRIAISHAAGVQSQLATVCEQLTESWGGWVETMELSDQRLAEYLVDAAIDRLRVLSPGRLSHMIREAARISHVAIIERPVVADGRVELLWYLQEQSISFDYHRYGNLGARAHEHRAAVL
jgi:RHH-type proline utilization regulon transcriptional repressor/proline dehydrogenase/delta 1-pyrroline-5-carboxylate dehydrogenase